MIFFFTAFVRFVADRSIAYSTTVGNDLIVSVRITTYHGHVVGHKPVDESLVVIDLTVDVHEIRVKFEVGFD